MNPITAGTEVKPMIYEEIAGNKRASYLLFFLFISFIVFLGWIFGEAFALGHLGIAIAIVLAIILSIAAYYNSDKIVLAISRARPASREEFPHLYHTVDGLAIAAGISKPKCYVIDDTAPNAFATGRDPEHAVICVTTGLLKKMNRAELEGVIAHEMSHIKNYDIRFMMLVTVMVGIVALMSDFMLRSFIWGGRSRNRGGGSMVIIGIALLLAVLAPIAGVLMKMALSRRREYLADASGALLTRYPEGLASALEKLAADKEPLEAANKATAHLYIINPLTGRKSRLNNLFSTHPPLEERVKRLRAM